MKEDILENLLRLAKSGQAIYLNPPCEEEVLFKMRNDAKKRLGIEVPEAYIEFLRKTNGAQIEGAFFKTGEDLVPENLDCPLSSILRLGNAGNVEEYIFDQHDGKFAVTVLECPKERFSTWSSFEGLLRHVMWQQQVLPLEIVIEGSHVKDFQSFTKAFNDAYARRGIEGIAWSGNWDAFNDYLSWPTWKYRLILMNADLCRQALGNTLFDKALEIIQSNAEYVELSLQLENSACRQSR